MRKKRGLIVSLALAFVLMLSASFALSFNKKETAKAEVTGAVVPLDLFQYSVSQSKAYYNAVAPKVATQANGLPGAYNAYSGKGVLVPLTKTDDNTGTPKYATTKAFDASNATKDEPLVSFIPVGRALKRVFLVDITDGTNSVKVYLTMGNASSAAYVNTAETNAYVQASGQSKIGGLTDGTTGSFANNAAANGIDVSAATGTPIDATGLLSVYYDATEKAIYTNNASGEKTLVRDLDATDATNGEDTAFAGFSGPVTVSISHKSGGGYASESGIPTAPTAANYGVVVTTLNGLNLAHNGLGYLAGYNVTDSVLSKGAYVAGGETTLPVGDTYTIPALERVDGQPLAEGEDEGWTTTVYNANKEDITAETLVGDVFTATEGGTYVIYRTKTVESTITVVSETITARVAGFENEYANIFEEKGANDGIGMANISFTSNLTTGESLVPEYSPLQRTGAMLTYESAYVHGTSGTNTKLAKAYAHIPSVKISDNTSANTLIAATPLDTADAAFEELVAITIAVYEKAEPTNYFTVTVYYFQGGAPIHAQAAATGQGAWGTRGASATQGNTSLIAEFPSFGSKEMVFSYDNANKAVYVNGKIIRDFDADDNTNGLAPRVFWKGFSTDEVGVMIYSGNGAGRVVVSNVDGHDLSYSLIEKPTGGYTAGLVTPLTADNYNATTFANIGETVTVPAPTSKLLTGDFVERTDITVVSIKVNGGEAIAYTKGETTFTAVAGVNKIDYLDGSSEVVATAYVYGQDQSLYGEFSGGTAKQSINNPTTLIAPGDYRLAQHKGMSAATIKDGLLVTAQRPSGEITLDNNIVEVKLEKEIYIGGLTADEPLIDFSHLPEYVSQQVVSLGFMLEDENGNTVKLVSLRQIPRGPGDVQYYGSAINENLSPINVFVNGVKTQLRQNSYQWYTGSSFIAKGVYTSGYYPGHLAIYYDKANQTLSVKGQSNGDNEIITHLNPSASDITTYKYPANRPTFVLGDVVKMTLLFEFDLDEEYTKGEHESVAPLSGRQDTASMLITTLAGQSFAQTNGVYTNNGVRVPKIGKDETLYRPGDAVTLPSVVGYYNFFADGGVIDEVVETGYTVDVKNSLGQTVETNLAPGSTFEITTLGDYTLVYKFDNGQVAQRTIKVPLVTVSFNLNGGYGSIASQTISYRDKATEPTAPTKTGHTFAGWFIGETEYDFDSEVTEDLTLTAKWTINTYTVTFNSNGGSAVENATANYNTVVSEPTAPTKTGYTFGGWFIGETEYDFDSEVTEDLTLTAKWTANEFTATFNSNGGSAVADQTIYYDGKVTEPTAPTKTGFAFGGWYKDIGLTNEWNFATDRVMSDITLYAKWNVNTYTVTFNSGGGSTVDAQTINYGETVTEPTAPTKTGYTFAGWFVGTEEYDFETLVAGDIELTAKWEIQKFAVTFNSNGGSAVSSQTINYGATATEPTAPTKTGYTFGGWFVGTEEYDFETEVTAPVVLTAKWTANEFTATFNSNGGSSVADQTIYYDGKVTEPSAPTRTGYTFLGWFVGTTEYDFNALVTGDIELTAKWEINTYTITFVTNSDSVVGEQQVTHGYKVSEPADPVKDGYTFLGWYKGETKYNFNSATTESFTLEAKWEETIETYTVTFNSNGGSTVDAQTINYGETATEPTAPTKTGYTFGGWFIGETEYDFDSEVTEDLTLTAKWTANEFTATFNSNGGSAVADQTIYYDGKVTEPTAPTKTGFAFGGWYKDIGLTNEWNFATDKVTSDITLYAKWTTETYQVSFSLNGGTGTATTQEITVGGVVTKPSDPTREGYVFGGWFVDGEMEEYDFTAPVTSNLLIKAKWNIISYVVTYETNGGNTIANGTAYHGLPIVFKPADPTKKGKTFDGWYVDEDCTIAWNFVTDKVTSDITLYAKWKNGSPNGNNHGNHNGNPDSGNDSPGITVPDGVTDNLPDTLPEDVVDDIVDGADKVVEKAGCAKEAVGLLAVVLSALAVVFVSKRR